MLVLGVGEPSSITSPFGEARGYPHAETITIAKNLSCFSTFVRAGVFLHKPPRSRQDHSSGEEVRFGLLDHRNGHYNPTPLN